jgi:hypothetical protein
VFDYAILADTAKLTHDSNRLAAVGHGNLKACAYAFFDQVKNNVFKEMETANVELRKRKASLIERNHLPAFDGEIFLTYATHLLCRVRLELRGGRYRIAAVISGPPNGMDLSRKEYPCNIDGHTEHADREETRYHPAIGNTPEQIAVEIVCGILRGEFL